MKKRTNDVLISYEFTQNRYCITLTIHPYRKNRSRSYWLSDASYTRFVALANNSECHFITILGEGEMGWRIRRKPMPQAHHVRTQKLHLLPVRLQPKRAQP